MTAKTVRVLCPESVVSRKLPVNFRDDDIALFDGEFQRVIPETSLLEFSNVRVGPEGVLFNGYQMWPQSFAFAANVKQWKLRSRIRFFINNYFLRKTRNFENEVLWVTDDWSSAYFHWLTDVLSRLYVMRDRMDELVLVLPHGYERLEFVGSSLRCFNVKSVEFIGANEVLRCRKIVMPSHTAPAGDYNGELIRGVRAVIFAAQGETDYNGPGERIYISRSRAAKRRIKNEDEVLTVLRSYGFETVYAEELLFEQQVKICSRARYLVSNHGAGLTNMLFAPEGTNILELRHHADRVRNFYFRLASVLNQNYFYQMCPAAPGTDDLHFADLVVDPIALEENIRLMVEWRR